MFDAIINIGDGGLININPSLIEIRGDGLTIEKVASVARQNIRVELTSNIDVRNKISASRQLLEKKLTAGEIIYGVNTGFGGNVRFLIPQNDLSFHQENLLRCLTCGVGQPLIEDAVRAAMLLRANALAKGLSGVRVEIIERMLDLLNHGITPVVPRYGSVGASGDLIPSAYIGRVLLGEGEVLYQGKKLPAAEALKNAKVQCSKLMAKEGLALINGTTVMTGIAALVIHDGAHLAPLVLACASLAVEALKATDDPFSEVIHRAKNHPGQMEAAEICRKLLRDSRYIPNLDELRAKIGETRSAAEGKTIRSEEAIQTPYSLRCAPQGIGPVLDALRAHRLVLEREINSVNDNPLIDPLEGRVYHTGNFYGGHVARALDSWKIDLATLANWLHAIMAMLVDDRFSNGLPPNLSRNPGVSSGFKGMQLCLTSLVCAMRHLANPSMIHTLPTEQYNQDMISLGTHAALTAMDMTAMAQDAAAISLLATCQAIDLRGGGNNLGIGNRAIFETVRKEVPILEKDRPLDVDITRISELIRTRLIPIPQLEGSL
ncbi:MAG TPA: aromatic amino acid ammonia-lyase [Candidatus Binatia bacterium]